MKMKLFIMLIVLAAIVLAVGGWAVDGFRWASGGGWVPGRTRVATA